jgi:tellurite resistance protein TerC
MEDEVTMDLLGSGTPLMWGGFLAFVLSMLAIDLGVFHRKSHAITFREAAGWSVVWVALALAFGGLVYLVFGPVSAMEYLTGYVVEKSLAVDNIFVFVAVFSAFAVPAVYQHRVLFWGVLGALLMRAAFIFAGAALLEHFHWTMYLFGGFLLLTGVKMLMQKEEASEVTHNPLYRLIRRWVPSTDGYRGGRFFVVEQGRRLATPLFFVLVLIEIVDLVFATDSIPAIFAITTDPFIVFTSNIFAILGLRSMYFLLADLVPRFVYLKTGLSMVLVFVGAKMLLLDVYEIPIMASLGVVLGLVGGSIVASLWATRGAEPERERHPTR